MFFPLKYRKIKCKNQRISHPNKDSLNCTHMSKRQTIAVKNQTNLFFFQSIMNRTQSNISIVSMFLNVEIRVFCRMFYISLMVETRKYFIPKRLSRMEIRVTLLIQIHPDLFFRPIFLDCKQQVCKKRQVCINI